MNFVQENSNVLYIWSGTISSDVEQEVNQLKTIPNVKVSVENADRVQLATYGQSQFDVILANVASGSAEVASHLLKLVKPKGKVVFKDDSANADVTRSNLLLSGFINIASLEGNVFVGEKPNYEVGSAAKLSLGGNKAKVAAVWKLDVDDEEDERIDADELLDEEDKVKPSAESLRVCGTTGKRKACKDCSCGLAEELESETKSATVQNTEAKSSCGSCYLGDAFRCASCPYLGIMSLIHKEGIKLVLNRNISTVGGIAKNGTCSVLNWDYDRLGELTYQDALAYVGGKPQPGEVSCLGTAGLEMHYQQEPGDSIVPEWDLICERTALRSTVQVALSVGKFFGASTFGILSDKYGRKSSFTVAALLYVVASLLTTFSPVYILLLLGRIGLGASASGVFYPAFALLTENIGKRHRSWMSIAFNFSYPIGMLILALAAYYIHQWRDLSLALTIPSFFLVIHLYFLVESPRWLLSKGRERRAYRMVFGRRAPEELCNSEKELSPEEQAAAVAKDIEPPKVPLAVRFKQSFSEFGKLYGTPALCRRALICHFVWCVTSLCYYVTALNADNFAANRNVYVATTGSVDILAYIISMIVLAYYGRRITSFCFFLYAGVCLLVVLGVSKESTTLLVTLAMLGRLGITAVYAVVTLHTAELFPTEIRNTALGICSTMAHVGSIAAPYIVDLLGQLAWWIPTTICGITILLAGMLTLLHPETKDAALKDHAKQEADPTEDREPMKQ